jgi:hypothetical protein
MVGQMDWRGHVAILMSLNVLAIMGGWAHADRPPQSQPAAAGWRVRLEAIHPWRPPFGIERVGRSRAVVVEAPDSFLPAGEMTIIAKRGGREVARKPALFSDKPPRIARAWFDGAFDFDQVILIAAAEGSGPVELARETIRLPAFEADAVARPEKIINPVDLNTILVPGDWLLLGPGQATQLAVRAIQRGPGQNRVTARAWFESSPDKPVSADLSLRDGDPADTTISLPGRASSAAAERDVLHVRLIDSEGRELWQKKITTMRVARPPTLPRFGAIQTDLRYDLPISVRDPATGKFSSMPYAGAWDAKLKDVVVALPNGSRLVFWRGSSYIPFWATRHNVGLCCEWAESLSPLPGATDCVEPLMDKELRYGRVEVVESTAARVHVRWTYQSTDLLYKVWGDQAVEDYYFYPDGFGTRVVTLRRDPSHEYELSEFIVLASPETYPLSIVPPQPLDILFPDAGVRHVNFPVTRPSLDPPPHPDVAPIYRLHAHKDDPASLVYFNPRQRQLPVPFGPFHDHGQLVTPAYWGSHWPLARGNATGRAIDDRIHVSPHHTSLASWGPAKPDPISTATGPSLDAQGRSKVMTTEQWVWMVGMSDAPDSTVLARARGFANPPSVHATGAHVHADGYAPQRRAIRLVADGAAEVTIKLTPNRSCVNPVIELDAAPGKLATIALDGRRVEEKQYAWDGHVLWLKSTFTDPVAITMQFDVTSR